MIKLIFIFALLAGPPLPPGLALAGPRLSAVSVINVGEEGLLQPLNCHVRAKQILRSATDTSNLNLSVFQCTNVFRFQWFAQTNVSYEVECSKDLRNWFPSGVIWEGTGVMETWLAAIDNSRMSYRIRVRE